MPKQTVSEVIARPTRTAVQATPSFAVTEFIDAFLYDMSDRQYGALVVLLTLIVGLVQNAVENYSGKGFLRKVPPTDAPVVDH